MKIQVTVRKPRNPLIATARARRAGAHERSATGLRFQAQRTLHRELAGLHVAERRRASP